MCKWVSVKDRLPNGTEGLQPAILHVQGNVYPLLLWDAYDEDTGEVFVGGFENGKFYVNDEAVDSNQLDISHWAEIEAPV